MYSTSTIQDILSILVTSIYDITERKLNKKDIKMLITLANFISGTRYRKREFYFTGKNGLGDLRYFFRSVRKYTRLVSDPKYELEEKTPLDFFNYIREKFRKFDIKKVGKVVYTLQKGSSKQVFNYILSDTVEKRIKSFTNVISLNNIELIGSGVFDYYILQNLRKTVKTVYIYLLQYLEKQGIPKSKYVKKFNKTINYLDQLFRTINPENDSIPIFNYYPKMIPSPYTQSTFTNPETIYKLLNTMEQYDDITEYKDIIENVILQTGEFHLPENVKEEYKKFPILKINNVIMKNNCANLHTLQTTAREVYTQDFEYITEIGDNYAVEIGKNIDIYRKILS